MPGVCLGMQLLFRGSEEGDIPGLGWIDGDVVRFQLDPADRSVRVPHMGWNYVAPEDGPALLAGFEQLPRFYFAHSKHVRCDRPEDVAG